MTDRIIEIADTVAFLSLENNLLKIRIPEKNVVTVPIPEIQCLILANPAITITGAAMAALASAGAAVVTSGQDRLPVAMSLPLNANYLQTERFHAQINASKPLLKRLWQTVIKEKISKQAQLLKKIRQNDFSLTQLIPLVLSGDPSNIEGRASVIYWKNLFPENFRRDRAASDNNMLLNYGYAVLRAMTARACCGAGLHPTLGINHHNRYDPYCLADDLMEPYRPVVDQAVFEINPENLPVTELSREIRKTLITALLEKVQTSKGMWQIQDLLRLSAEQTARSFQSGENVLEYF